jgi:NADPH-dependent 2,4-dienoyl-CoA reductase/sulfur reductase-like enzyme
MSARLRVVVVGAGPGGMAAAVVAAEAGCRVVLLDESQGPGGQIWRRADPAEPAKPPQGRRFAHWLSRLRASGAEFWPGLTVVDQRASGLVRVERAVGWEDLSYDRLILAPGARERFLPFPGWTLPGVLGAGGLQALVKGGLPVAGCKVVVAGSGPLLLAVGAGLVGARAKVEGIFEQAPWTALASFGLTLGSHPGKLAEGARYRWQTLGSPYKPGWWVARALGERRLRAVVVSNGRAEREIACEYLACGFHLTPNLELPRLLGCRIEAGFVAVNPSQETSQAGVYCVGEATGIGGLEKALIEGQIAAWAASGRTVEASRLAAQARKHHRFARGLDTAFALRKELRGLAAPDTIVCRCEDVTRRALEGRATGRAARLHTRCGMGPCQGRVCGPATEFLFDWSAVSPRPPLFPARVSTLAGDARTSASAVTLEPEEML